MKKIKWHYIPKTALSILLITALCLALVGCNDEDNQSEVPGFVVYDVSYEGMKLVANNYEMLSDNSDKEQLSDCVKELLNRMIEGNKSADSHGAIGKHFTRVEYRIENDIVNIDFDAGYFEATQTDMILRRAAVTRTLCNLEGVEGVTFTVDDVPIVDSNGNAIGIMTPDSFLENDGAQINTFERADIHLFFADESGQNLVEAIRSLVYSSNIPLERIVVERVIAGPIAPRSYPVCDDTVNIISVTTQDGICYVDLGKEFLNKTKNVSDKVLIYSLVNSLTQLPNINKVQFMIEGDTNAKLGEMDLSVPLERKLTLLNK